MRLLLPLVLSLSTLAVAAKWEIKSIKGKFVAELAGGSKIELAEVNGNAKIVDWKESPKKGLWLLVYDSGFFGTSVQIQVHRAVIIKKSNMKILGDYPFRYFPLDEKQKVEQPKWSWNPKNLTIYDNFLQENPVIPYR